jgi:GNAT superfamily N-acetyltransferase
LITTRDREESDVEECARALLDVHQASGYPDNWPADPAGWLRPPGILRSWVAVGEDIPVAGHVILKRPRPGSRSAEISRLFVVPAARRRGVAMALLDAAMSAAAADGRPVSLRRYAWSR